ncbi:MAG TPA: hypothetical protein ENI96_01550 [Sedimenticola thiotaurini]|uniref:endopeptidase La n=1 Tax=Sedimenticola thiotaurini TaxID=1543721 RepID=A0A831RLJ3_9GAMM|nr:hypothetical protein [Sedimenticola thiotaurini]
MDSSETPKPLPVGQLYHASRLQELAFETTDDLEPLAESIGQERVLEAIQTGIAIDAEGFNLYAAGSSGLGRHTLIGQELRGRAAERAAAADWVYVASFQDPYRPRCLSLPAGRGGRLRRQMEQLVDDLISAIPAAFQGDEYRRRAAEIDDEFSHREDQAALELGQRAAERGIVLMRGPSGFTLMPGRDGESMTAEEYQKLPAEERQRIDAAMEAMKEELKQTMSQLPRWHREMRQRYLRLNRETARLTVAGFIGDLKQAYQAFPAVVEYLDQVADDVVEHLDRFRQAGEAGEGQVTARDPAFKRYQVNVLVDNGGARGAPVVFEANPTYQNLLGRVEQIAHLGTLQTDFTLIKPGALHRANGGFLVLDAEKVLSSPFAWEGLKRVLRAREIRIEPLERQLSLVGTVTLEPQPVPIDLKVVLIGDRLLFYLLKEYDPEFGLLFKIAADFSEELPRSSDNELLYARLVATLQRREGLRPLSRGGVARVLEQCARRAGDGERLSLHLGGLLDLLRESNLQAERRHSPVIRRRHVQGAVDARLHRSNQLQARLREQILRGVIRIDTDGLQLAQVNGLTVIDLGDFSFGAPARISATARLGEGEFIDIERETELGGPIHSKGVLILTSYLGERYAKHQPLPVVASLVMEQSYGLVEGDSASAAELCALLSALGDIPLKQSLAITGSINQRGQMQAIGGVCEKIEGFFDICNARGLAGEHGVIIPAANVKDLMLRHEVVEAAREGRFHIYAVDHVEQAMSLLCGLAAGVAGSDGTYPEQSFNYRIQLRLAQWIGLRQRYASHPKGEG